MKTISLYIFIAISICSTNLHASLIGDTVTVDRRYEDTIMSSRSVTVESGIELFNWQNLYFDFSGYSVVMMPASTTAYFGTGFNGFDFSGLDFGLENEIISAINAYYISAYDRSIYYLDQSRLSFSDNAFRLNLAGSGFGSDRLYIEMTTTITNVAEPPNILLLLLGVLLLKSMYTSRKYTQPTFLAIKIKG
ncbi:hypothetical protein ACFL0R_03405 [Pseudomonadota bacterium]